MTKQEFLDTLRRALNRELEEREVEENIQFYDQYISEQIRQGKTEEMIMTQLGDPRLIARTILQVDERREMAGEYSGSRSTTQSVYTEDENGQGYYSDYSDSSDAYTTEEENQSFRSNFHSFQIKGWMVVLVLVLILVLLLTVLGVAVRIIWKLLPVLLVLYGGYWIYQRIKRR